MNFTLKTSAKSSSINGQTDGHQTAVSHPSASVTETVVRQFEAQVERTPEAIALICGGHTLTYRQLNTKANQLAHFLQRQGILAESAVALCCHRSVEMLVAIWGILKAGGAYVPLDPSHPRERISLILQDTQARWVLTQSDLIDRLSGSAEIVALDALDLGLQASNNLPSSPALSQLAYCLYTSGSTGLPKGVEIEHHSLANYVQWANQQYVRERVLAFPLFSPLSFDLTVTSIFVPLLSGGQVVIYPENGAAIDLSLRRIFQDNAVDIIKLTPSHLALVQGMALGNRVKTLILGGEDLKTALAREIASRSEQAIEIYNEYGPTEATVGCMIHRFAPEADALNTPASVSIGSPAAGSSIRLLDEWLNDAPWGEIGEIFVGGSGLARGYLNRPELTAERFIWRAGKRLYRTGDLGRWEEKGQLTYLGRCDRQLKLNSIRIEPGEIEAAIATHPQISACVVTIVQVGTQGSSKQLGAYYTSHGKQPVPTAALRDVLARLPSSIHPAYFIPLDRIPLTPNGKVDLAALPSPQTRHPGDRSAGVAPQTSTEKQLIQIWQQVLQVEHLGVHDNFFDLGGDSIRAIQIAARLSEAGLEVLPDQIFRHSTVSELAVTLASKAAEQNSTSADSAVAEDFFRPKLKSGQMDKLSALLNKADQSKGVE